MIRTNQSTEPLVTNLVNDWLKSHELECKLNHESLNSEIDKALNEYFSRIGGSESNRPDIKLLLQDKHANYWPVLIECKGKLEKLNVNGDVDSITTKNEINHKNVKSYAVNGAIYYANSILHYTNYENIISIGITGYKDELNKLQLNISVYLVAKSNFGVGQKIGEYNDLSFLKNINFNRFIDKVNLLKLTPDKTTRLKEQREKEFDHSLTKLNNDICKDESCLGENERVYIVVASIITTLGVHGKVKPLSKEDLLSSIEEGNQDGDIILRKLNDFLKEKKVSINKQNLIVNTLKNTLLTENINKPINGESQLKRVFSKVVDHLGLYYKIGLNTDFTGKLFNEMYSWLGFTQDKLNDVVLTPSYVSTLLVKLARVNKDSYVWDFATGSAGLLIAAMNEMLNDAKEKITSPNELSKKELEIKAKQLLGLEVLPSVHMLAILNMVITGDGSTNILNEDSLTQFDGKFPATALVLNPPYSAEGNGMIFVRRALSMMNKGYAAIIIQNSAGSGKAKDINKEILKSNRLLASIKMPIDLFSGKASVHTNIYVFRVGEVHENDYIVKFIDFRNDGYSRNRSKKYNTSLIDVDHAKERYKEVVDLVKYGKSKLNYISESDYYEGHIDVTKGDDWNQSTPVDIKATLYDFKKTIGNYITCEISNVFKKTYEKNEKNKETDVSLIQKLNNIEWDEYKIGDLFEVNSSKKIFHANKETVYNIQIDGSYPYVVRKTTDNGIRGYLLQDEQFLNPANTLSFAQDTFTVFYQKERYYTGNKIKVLTPKFENLAIKLENISPFIVTTINKSIEKLNWGDGSTVEMIESFKIMLPTKNNKIDFKFIENFVKQIKDDYTSQIGRYFNEILEKTTSE